MAADFVVRGDTRLDGSGFSKGLSKLASTAKKGLKIVGTATAGALTAIGAAGISYNASMEQYQTAFETMLGGKKAADELTGSLKTLAAQTPLAMSDLADASKTLLAFGTSADDLPDTLKRLGDVALGDAEKLGTMATAFGRIQSNGRASMEEINMMIDQGFNPLNIIAEKTGESMEEVRKRVSEGAVSFEEIADAVKAATNEGGQFYNAMESQSKTLTGQLSTLKDNALAFAGELSSGVTEAISNVFLPKAIGTIDELQTAFEKDGAKGLINAAKKILKNLSKTFIDGFLDIGKKIADTLISFLPPNLQKPFKAAVDKIYKVLKNGGIDKIVDVITDTFKDFSKIVEPLVETLLPLLADAFEFLVDNIDILLPSIMAAVGAFKGFKIIQSVIEWAKTLFATLSANPFGLVLTAVSLLVGGIVSLVEAAKKGTREQQLLAESSERLGDSFGGAGEAAAEFYEGIQNAESHLSEFNDELFASSEEQRNLENNMQEIQNGITTICKTASDERREYTEEEILQLDEYFEKLSDLADQQLQIQEEKAKAIQQQAVSQSQAFNGSLEEYKTIGQEWLKTAQEQRDQQIALIQEQTTTELTLLNQKYGDQAILSNDAYKAEYDELMRRKDEKIRLANEEVSAVGLAYSTGYSQRTEGLTNWLSTSSTLAQQEEIAQQEHNERMKDIETRSGEELASIQKSVGDAALGSFIFDLTTKWKYRQEEKEEENRYNQEIADIRDKFNKDFDEDVQEQLGTWMTMLSQTEMYGGDISEEDKKMVDAILDEYDRLPPEAQEAMKNAMTPMLDEMEKAEPSLFEKASSIAGGILNRLKTSFDINSPSKKTREIFQNVMKGAELGIDKGKKNLMKSVQDVADATLKQFENMDADSMISKMQAAVSANSSRVGTAYAAFGNYQAARNSQGFSGDSFAAATTNNQYITFEQPMQAPDEIARALRIQQTFGLAGAR